MPGVRRIQNALVDFRLESNEYTATTARNGTNVTYNKSALAAGVLASVAATVGPRAEEECC